MKKVNKKLSLNKKTVVNLNNVTGGYAEVSLFTCVPGLTTVCSLNYCSHSLGCPAPTAAYCNSSWCTVHM